MQSKEEVWKPVAGYYGYEVSNLGRIRSRRSSKHPHGVIILRDEPRILKCGTGGGRYRTVKVFSAEGVMRRLLVHRVVLEAFVGPCPEGMVACHNNSDNLDNRADNLRWDTPYANQTDRIEVGRSCAGTANSKAKLNEQKVQEIRARAKSGQSVASLSTEYGLSRPAVSSVVLGLTWKHVPNPDGTPYISDRPIKRSPLNSSVVQWVRGVQALGMRMPEIAKRLGVSVFWLRICLRDSKKSNGA